MLVAARKTTTPTRDPGALLFSVSIETSPEQATQILPMTDAIAARVRKNGARTLRSIGHIARMQRPRDNDHELETNGASGE